VTWLQPPSTETVPTGLRHDESLNPLNTAFEQVVDNVHALQAAHWSVTLSSTT
jgi:hypothetical protein